MCVYMHASVPSACAPYAKEETKNGARNPRLKNKAQPLRKGLTNLALKKERRKVRVIIFRMDWIEDGKELDSKVKLHLKMSEKFSLFQHESLLFMCYFICTSCHVHAPARVGYAGMHDTCTFLLGCVMHESLVFSLVVFS